MTPTFTLGSIWVEQYVSSMVLLNILLGHPTATTALRTPDAESLPQTLNEIARGSYQPARYFQTGGPARARFILRPPELAQGETYTVVVLNASTPESDFVSVATGGIVFEDPAWAVFAAYSLAQDPKRGVPLARDNRELWNRLSLLSAAIHDSKYAHDEFLGLVTGFVEPASGPSFKLMQISGAQLIALRSRGLQSFGSPAPRFYLLFGTPGARLRNAGR